MKQNKRTRSIFAKLCTVALLLLAAGILCYGALVAFVYYQEVHVPVPTEKADALIVLGAQVQPSGEPSVQLAWRLEAALEVFNQNPVPIVVSGGQGGNEPRPEGDVMRDWLTEKEPTTATPLPSAGRGAGSPRSCRPNRATWRRRRSAFPSSARRWTR
jgi:vancomycin permeability regulator SanA